MQGRRIVIAGLSRLTARVASILQERHADVVVIGDPADDDAREIAAMLDASVRVVVPGRDRDGALVDAGLAEADGFLAIDDDDLENLRYIADAHEVAPKVPAVLRSFQPELTDRLDEQLNIRRAYSVAALAAPAFVAASVNEEVVETLRLADDEIPLCILDVHEQSPLAGSTPSQLKQQTDCAVIAVKRSGASWQSAALVADALDFGDRVLVGGRDQDVLHLAIDNDAKTEQRRRREERRRPREKHRRHITATLLPVSAAIFALVFLVTAIVNGIVFHDGPIESFSVALGAAFGNTTPPTDNSWVQVFNLAATISAFILLWVLLSHITALVLAERFEQRMTRRARRMHDHVVVVGLGTVGYRVVQLLAELGVVAVAIEAEPDSRFIDSVGLHTPVLTGDGRLSENLERCGVPRARCIVACTDDDFVNLSACLEARGLNPGIRTVARVFDDAVAARLRVAFRVDTVLSSTTIAASAFVGAATDELAMRSVSLDDLELLAFRFSPGATVDPATLDEWRGRGLRVLAVRRDGVVEPPTRVLGDALRPSDEAIVVGPADLLREFADAYGAPDDERPSG